MTYYAVLATVLAGLLLVSLVSGLFYRARFEQAKKLIEDHREQQKWVPAVLKAYSEIIKELRKQGFTMGEGDDDIDPTRCFLQTKETRPSGLVINVMAALNRNLNPAYYWVRIFVVFSHQDERVGGVLTLKGAITALVKARFSPLSQEYQLDQLPVDFVDIVSRIARAVKFYEEAIESVESDILYLNSVASDLEKTQEELEDTRNNLQIRINDIVARLAEPPSLSETV